MYHQPEPAAFTRAMLLYIRGGMELPHTAGCLVCGRQNVHGLGLSLHVEEGGLVWTEFTPRAEHIGFEGIIHGGLLATVLDEAMVWAATWAGKRFCVAGEMSVRFRRSAAVGRPLRCEARVESAASKRPGLPRLIHASGRIVEADGGALVAEATGKYVPVSPERNRHVVATLVDEPTTRQAATVLKEAAT
jgi:acyl-coenzyme A thioesterase PaaI-like protein